MIACRNVCPYGHGSRRGPVCELPLGHEGPHRSGLLSWHDPPLFATPGARAPARVEGQMAFSQLHRCPACDGTGREEDGGRCLVCLGSGSVAYDPEDRSVIPY